MWCPSRFSPWSSTVYLVYHPSQYSYSPLSLNHHLYADDTQLFFSFYPSVFDSSVTLLQHSLQKISSWMTANLLTLNSSKTNFFLSASYNNLPKLIPAHWLLLTQLATLVLSLMNTSLSLIKYLLYLNLAIIIFVNFAVFVLILTLKLPVPSPLLSFILKLTTATHCTIIFTVSDKKKLQNIQNSLVRAVTRTPKSSHIIHVLKSLYTGWK